MDGERCEISQDVQDTIDWDTRKDFVKGFPNEMYLRVKVAGYQSLDGAYRQAVKATQELKRENNRTRYQRPTPPNNYNRNNARPLNNNNNIGNNHQDRRFVPPSQNHPNAPRQNTITYNYCKKPGHLVKDCYKFKAQVNAGVNRTLCIGTIGKRPSGERGEPQRNHTPNRPRAQAATRRPVPTARNRMNAMLAVKPKKQPLNTMGNPSCSHAKKQAEDKKFQDQKEKKIQGVSTKNHQESD